MEGLLALGANHDMFHRRSSSATWLHRLHQGICTVKGEGLTLVANGQTAVFTGHWEERSQFSAEPLLIVSHWEVMRPEDCLDLVEYLRCGEWLSYSMRLVGHQSLQLQGAQKYRCASAI